MTDVVDLSERRAVQDTDPHLLVHDDRGVPLWWFAVSYEMDGKKWTTRILAYSWTDAENRLTAIRTSGVVYGQIMGEVPA